MKKTSFLIIPVFILLTRSVWGQETVNENIIAAENARPGTTDWIMTKVARHAVEPHIEGWHRRTAIEGYVSHMSIRAGDTLKIYVSTNPAAPYQIDIFRMGYYGGKGGRHVKRISILTENPRAPAGVTQPTPEDGENNIQECQWDEGSISLKVPDDWVSGVYLGKLSTWRFFDAEAYIIFIVRDDRKADLIFQCSDFTWQSYNRWPQWRSMYDGPGSRKPDSYSSGFDRPYAIFWNGIPAKFEPLTNGSGEFLMTEFPLAFWLEKEGYDVTYISNLDAHEDVNRIMRGKVFLSVGHDEYWTQELYDNVLKARDAGVNLAFLSGNSVSGRIELLTSSDGRPNRGIRWVPGKLDDVELMGARSYGVGIADWTCVVPEHWAFEGTGMKKGDKVPYLVGWEFHGPPLAENHKDLVVLAEGPVKDGYGNPSRRNRTYATTIYTAEKGNYVFNAATCWWNKVLSCPHAYINPPYIDFSEGDERIRRITKNILDRMIAVEINE